MRNVSRNSSRAAPSSSRSSKSAFGCALAYASAALLAVAGGDAAAQFRVIAANGTIMYDGPSARANKLFVASANLPVEIITTDGAWARVRDHSGDLAWVERKSLAERKMVIVTAASVEARQDPDDRSPGTFQATQGVVLDVLDANSPGWLRVRHRDGVAGYVRLREVWGQ